MNAKFVNYAFATLILLICGSFSVFSQNKCNLQIGVYEFKEDGSSEDFPVKDAKIQLVDTKTRKSLKISRDTEAPVYTDVAAGEYRLTVSKEGFKKTLEIFSTDCSTWVNEQNTYSLIVFLWKGDSKQTVELGKSGSTGGYYDVKGEKPINNGAVLLARPEFPRAARAVKAYGAVNVQVAINELGYVISAYAIDGHPLLRSAAVEAAKKSKFRMTFLEGFPVKVTGIIVYNFVP